MNWKRLVLGLGVWCGALAMTTPLFAQTPEPRNEQPNDPADDSANSKKTDTPAKPDGTQPDSRVPGKDGNPAAAAKPTVGTIPAVAPSTYQAIASYNIKASLNPKKRQVIGSLLLDWKNTSTDNVGDLWFHLYMNAFKNERSSFLKGVRNAPPSRRFSSTNLKHWGWIDVKSIQVVNGEDLTPRMKYRQPDDNNPDDRTVMQVKLKEPVNPGQTLRLRIKFVTQLPEAFARTGFRGNFFMVAQWFPKIGVYESAKKRGAAKGAWNCHQFHMASEFYSDFGTYKAELTVPKNFIVGATGEQTKRESSGSTVTYTFVQDRVHDFAWAAYPGFVKLESSFLPSKDVTAKDRTKASKLLGVPASSFKLGKVKIILLTQESKKSQGEHFLQAAKDSLKFYGLMFGAYPYKTLTIIDPPWEGRRRAIGGMEYATLFTVNLRWLDDKRNTLGPYMTLIHEFGHQYFQGLIASNEMEAAWLDEGVNTYTNMKMIEWVLGQHTLVPRMFHLPLSFMPLEIKDLAGMLQSTSFRPDKTLDPINQPTWKYYSFGSYGMMSYNRTALTLYTLERQLGTPAMMQALRNYALKWRFRHPKPKDFFASFQNASKYNLSFFFDQFFGTTKELDYAVRSAVTSKDRKALGVFTKNGSTTTQSKYQTTKQYLTRVVVERKGDAVWPTTVRFKFSDGVTINKAWSGKDRWKRFIFRRKGKLQSVHIDPENKLPLDRNRSNNSYLLQPKHPTVLHWSSRMMLWLQSGLLIVTSIFG
ncbi:MAG: M1 family peptidase [Deltaproteobacteria bacterium]|nr:MAG: M1 family peptidase [Deltaproteobacteria bacterium]